jgi:hypothetical protein
MTSKTILPEEERNSFKSGQFYLLEMLEISNCFDALLASESEAQEDKESYLNTIIEKDSKIHELISRIQELEKFIKECKSLVKSNVPEMVRKAKEYKV